MLKLIIICIVFFPLIIYYGMRIHYAVSHPKKYDVIKLYELLHIVMTSITRHSRVKPHIYGAENLPSEGGYTNNHNNLQDFMAGTFKCSLKSKTPIIPVALIDSYKVYYKFSFKPVHTQVHYLEPIYYDEYKDLSTKEIANMIKERIQTKINEVTK